MPTSPLRIPALLPLLAALSLLPACGRDDRPAPGAQPNAVRAEPEAVARKAKNAAITAQIRSSLEHDDDLRSRAIQVEADGGRVLLRGSAPDTAARARATDMARVVAGVVEVDNELSVQRTR